MIGPSLLILCYNVLHDRSLFLNVGWFASCFTLVMDG
jgi:hypothetical protein